MSDNRSLHFIQLALSIVIMSSSGFLGRFISLPVPLIIWIRCVIGGTTLFLFLKLTGGIPALKKGRETMMAILASFLIAGHWLAYFWSLKLSSVAIGMLSLFTYPVITSLLEPLILKTQFKWMDVVLALFALGGVIMLVPSDGVQNNVTLGILMGVFSALLYSFRNIITKHSVRSLSGTVLMFYQLVFVVVILLPVLILYPLEEKVNPIKDEWLGLALLGIYTTAVGHTLLVRSFAHFSVTMVSIMTCLVPLLGIWQGYLFLNEEPTEKVIIGGSIILFSVLVESVRSIKK